MSFRYVKWLLFSLVFLSLTACVSTPRPERVVILTPKTDTCCGLTTKKIYRVSQSSVRCTVIEGRWYYQTWIPQHNVCFYGKYGKKVAFVDGYWKCGKYSARGRCVGYKWVPGSLYSSGQVIVY